MSLTEPPAPRCPRNSIFKISSLCQTPPHCITLNLPTQLLPSYK